MKTKSTTSTIATGMAMFSMFFGAGNVVFPLITGQYAQDLNAFAMAGLMITAVGVPFLGLSAMTLFDGDYKLFFDRIGKKPGFILSCLILGLIGPLGASPRCITLSYSTLKFYMPEVSLILFSILSCLLIFALTVKRGKIVDVLGYILTPALIISLGIIIVMGWVVGPPAPPSNHSSLNVFMKGLLEGYQTMDLLGAFFFSSVVLACLRQEVNPADKKDYKRLIKMTLKAGCIGMGLLAICYFGFSYVAAFYSGVMPETPSEELAGALAVEILGPYAGIVACLAVSLSCLTTAIALSSVSAEFIHIDLSKNRISYTASLVIVMILTFLVSTLHFDGIKQILAPILEVSYPALILLSALNVAHKLYRWEIVKVPVLVTFLLTLGYYLKNSVF